MGPGRDDFLRCLNIPESDPRRRSKCHELSARINDWPTGPLAEHLRRRRFEKCPQTVPGGHLKELHRVALPTADRQPQVVWIEAEDVTRPINADQLAPILEVPEARVTV